MTTQSYITGESLDIKHRLWSLFMCVNWFCDPVKDFCRVSDGEHAVELAWSLLIPPRLFLVLGTRNILLGKGNNNKSSSGLVFRAWLALPCSPFAGGLWTYSLFLLLFYRVEYVPPPRATNSHIPWTGWSASAALLCPTTHTYIPLQFAGLQSVI